MITKFEKYKLLKESPDNIDIDDLYVHCNDSDAVGFASITNKDQSELIELEVTEQGDLHGESGLDSDTYSYPGRLWLDSKVMSFWVYPNDVLFRQIIKELERKLDIKIFNNNWKIEIIKNDGEIRKRE